MSRAAAILLVLSALALVPSSAPAAPPRTVATCEGARLDKAAGVARRLSDCGRVEMSRGAEAAARQALGRLANALGVRHDTRDLALMRISPTSAGPRVRFQQSVAGVPVHNGQLTVALGNDGAVLRVASSGSAARRLDPDARVSAGAAVLTARRRVPSGFDLLSPPTTTRVAEPIARGGLELAWLVVLRTRAPRGDWNVVVSARSGDVLSAYDTIKYVDGTALTNATNPVQQTGNTSLRDNADSNQTVLNTARTQLTLTDLNAGTSLLRGTYVDTASSAVTGCTLPYVPGQASSASRNYSFDRSQDAFEETVAYAAITRVMRSNAALGFPSILARPLPINVHCFPDVNAFYSPDEGTVSMGDGGVDLAEDADVIVHESGHAIQHAQVPGFGPGQNTEQRAIGEGFGDFLATFTYLADGNAAYQAGRRFCMGDWIATELNPADGGNAGSGCFRWVNGRDELDGSDIGTYSGTPQEEHNDGRYWSATLTCVFNGIAPSLGTAQARNRMLTLVIAHNFDLVPDESDGAFGDSLDALRQEDKVRFDGNEITRINTCGEQRLGIVPPDSTPPTVDGTLTPAAPNGAGGWYRTAPSVDWTVSDPQGGLLAKGCADAVLAPDTTGRTVTCTAISDGGVTARSLSFKKDSTPPSLVPALSVAAPAVGQPATAAPNAGDATSGVAAQSCGVPDTSSAGPHTVACSATDNAGNAATRTLAFTVGFAGAPRCSASVARRRPGGRTSKPLRGAVTCDRPASVRAVASLSAPRKRGKKPRRRLRVALGPVSGTVQPGRTTTLALPIPRAVARRQAGRTVSAVLTVTARDATGNEAIVSAQRRLRLARRGAPRVVIDVDRGIDPSGVPRERGCRGRVRLVVSDNRRILARATVSLTRNCRYRKRFRIVRSRIGRARRLDLTAHFSGNAALGKATFRFRNSIRVPT